ncbi:hypothetical protein TNCV_4318631 [Trichonephila clavipes]|nr:hypothetical protein TNCV_4318631 [Trichonephila clavipes]
MRQNDPQKKDPFSKKTQEILRHFDFRTNFFLLPALIQTRKNSEQQKRNSVRDYDEEESNDEEYNSKYDSSTEIDPDLEEEDTSWAFLGKSKIGRSEYLLEKVVACAKQLKRIRGDIIEEIKKAQILPQESEKKKQISSRPPWWTEACGHLRAEKRKLLNKARKNVKEDWIKYKESLVYADKPQTLDHLEDIIRRVIADIRPQMLEKVIEN